MDYTSLPAALSKASLFELWRLKAAITRALENPCKNEAMRAGLRVGQSVRYFDETENREISGCIIEIKRSRALIRHDHDKKLWNIPFYMINLQAQDIDVPAKAHQKASRDSLGVGDAVGYRSRTNREVYGTITRLNRKTATVRLTTGELWRVPYGFLFSILDVPAGPIQETAQYQIENAPPEAEEYLPE
jgi:hypothetical protein